MKRKAPPNNGIVIFWHPGCIYAFHRERLMSNSPFIPSDPFNVNFGQVQTTLSPKRAYKLSEVKDQLETVAFDIVRFKSDDAAGSGANLWQVNSAEDGD